MRVFPHAPCARTLTIRYWVAGYTPGRDTAGTRGYTASTGQLQRRPRRIGNSNCAVRSACPGSTRSARQPSANGLSGPPIRTRAPRSFESRSPRVPRHRPETRRTQDAATDSACVRDRIQQGAPATAVKPISTSAPTGRPTSHIGCPHILRTDGGYTDAPPRPVPARMHGPTPNPRALRLSPKVRISTGSTDGSAWGPSFPASGGAGACRILASADGCVRRKR